MNLFLFGSSNIFFRFSKSFAGRQCSANFFTMVMIGSSESFNKLKIISHCKRPLSKKPWLVLSLYMANISLSLGQCFSTFLNCGTLIFFCHFCQLKRNTVFEFPLHWRLIWVIPIPRWIAILITFDTQSWWDNWLMLGITKLRSWVKTLSKNVTLGVKHFWDHILIIRCESCLFLYYTNLVNTCKS